MKPKDISFEVGWSEWLDVESEEEIEGIEADIKNMNFWDKYEIQNFMGKLSPPPQDVK